MMLIFLIIGCICLYLIIGGIFSGIVNKPPYINEVDMAFAVLWPIFLIGLIPAFFIRLVWKIKIKSNKNTA